MATKERYALAVAAAAAALILYVKTLCGDIFWQDSGLYNRSVALFGIGVPPGFPSYHLFCYLFTTIPGLDAIVGMNAFSAVAGAATAFFIVLLFYEIAPPGLAAAAGAAVAALAYVAAPTIWLQATTCEVYTLNMTLTAATVWALFVWCRLADRRWLYAAAFFYGLACTNHPQQAVLLVPYAAFVLYYGRRGLARRRDGAFLVAFWLLAMSTYLYLPVRSATGVPMDWGKTRTLYGLYFHLTCKEFQRQMFAAPWAVVSWRLSNAAWLYVAQFGWPLIAAAAVGGGWLAWRRRADFVFFFLLSFFTLILTVNYPSYGFRAWYFTFYMLSALCTGFAVAWLAGGITRRSRAAGAALATVAVAAVVALVPARFFRADRNYYPYSRDYSANHLRAVSYRAMFFLGEDNSSGTGGIYAVNTVELKRPDIFFVDTTGNANYFDVFAFGGEDLSHAPAAVVIQRYYDIVRGLLATGGREFYFLYPYSYLRYWGYTPAADGVVFRAIPPGGRPVSDMWRRTACRGVWPPTTYLDYWGVETVSDHLYKRGDWYLARRDEREAWRWFWLAGCIGRRSASAQHNLGSIFFLRGEWARAAPYYRRALALDPTISVTRYMLAICLDRAGRRDLARQELRRLLEYEPTYEPARVALRTGQFIIW